MIHSYKDEEPEKEEDENKEKEDKSKLKETMKDSTTDKSIKTFTGHHGKIID